MAGWKQEMDGVGVCGRDAGNGSSAVSFFSSLPGKTPFRRVTQSTTNIFAANILAANTLAAHILATNILAVGKKIRGRAGHMPGTIYHTPHSL